jgi:hypothetical protein
VSICLIYPSDRKNSDQMDKYPVFIIYAKQIHHGVVNYRTGAPALPNRKSGKSIPRQVRLPHKLS